MSRRGGLAAALLVTNSFFALSAAHGAEPAAAPTSFVLVPDRVFDGRDFHTGWVVWVEGDHIRAVGPPAQVAAPANVERQKLAGQTLLPGLIDLHTHVLLHPYDEAEWNDQVLREPEALRIARATVQLRDTLAAGFTTIRDLGTEGAHEADVGLKQAIETGVIPGPRMVVVTRAIVATGSYAPKGFAPSWQVPQGADEADGSNLPQVVRRQIGFGADWIKIYADFRWGARGETRPTFTQDEVQSIVEVAKSSGRPTVAHASSPEGMRRATLAGVETIEHGDEGTLEVFRLMRERGVAYCPTLAASEAVARYAGWKLGEPEPPLLLEKRKSLRAALDAGVTLCFGTDAGVFRHGDNARELELLVDYGAKPLDALRSATSINAKILHREDQLGSIRAGLLADLVAVEGDPSKDIHVVRRVSWVMKGGVEFHGEKR